MKNKEKFKHLQKMAHNCKPVIWIGQHGLTENVINEIELALDHHELIKIKLRVGTREEKEKLITTICEDRKAQMIQKIGGTLTIYRPNPENPVIQFPRS